MSLGDLWPWITLAALGAYHGINPAMGWLFAVALGLQERSRGAVFSAFPSIALGHAASVALVVGVVVIGRTVVSIDALKIVGCVVLVGFGTYKLMRSSHPRWVGMCVGFRDLTAWSFLMASAHGAGLMLVPILLRLPGYRAQEIDLRDVPHVEYMALGTSDSLATLVSQAAAVGIHTLAMFGVMAAVAVIVFEKVGVSILRRGWFNLDRVWAIVLIVAGVLTLVI